MGKFCGKCGAALVEGVAFCASCGAAVESMGYSEPEPQQSVVNEDMYAENQNVIENGFAGDETRLLYEPQPQSQYEPQYQAQTQSQYQPQQQPQYEQQYQAQPQQQYQAQPQAQYQYQQQPQYQGQPQPQYQAQQQYMGNSYYPDMYAQPTKKSGKKKLVIILSIAGAVVIGAIVLICCLIFGGNDYEEAVQAYYKVAGGDITYNNICTAFGESTLEEYLDCQGYTVAEFKRACKEFNYEYNSDSSYESEYLNVEIYNVYTIEDEDLEDYDDGYPFVPEKGVRAIVSYTYKHTYDGEASERIVSDTISVIKYNGDWCVGSMKNFVDEIIYECL
ncbi:MAG: zinc-ribbon domain-containing protein [Ruminococcus sp.]|nr:zinc-ribbon domain-containing protein [Ruminococcus sp.]